VGSRSRQLAVLAACVIALAGCGGTNDPPGQPTATVREFLVDGAIDGNGFDACGYLTLAQQRAAAWLGGGECRNALDSAQLALGGKSVGTEYQVDRLAMAESIDGDHARVRLTRGGAAIDFELVRADAAERNQFSAPASDWRIASGWTVVLKARQMQ
jgi:hypothetical protein